MSIFPLLGQLLRGLLLIWIVGCFLSFISGFVLTMIPFGWPLPLPWSDFKDFVETPDGRVLVELRFYNRVLCYDRNGNFVAVYRLPYGAKSTRLAAGKDNRVYLRAFNKVTTYSPDWEPTAETEADRSGKRIWELDRESGQPVHAPQRDREPPSNRPVGPGDLLFTDLQHRDEFHCADGSTLVRDGNTLKRLAADGDVVATYATPWPLRPFVFPFPAVLAWPGVFLLFFLARRRARNAGTVASPHSGV